MLPILVSMILSTLPLADFEDGLPANLTPNNAEARVVDIDGAATLRVHFDRTDWPNITFRPPTGEPWDWSDWTGIRFLVNNPESEPIQVAIRVDNPGHEEWLTAPGIAQPGESVVESRFNTTLRDTFWGMRGAPELGPLPMGASIDLTNITAFQLFLPRPTREHTLEITGIELFGPGASDPERIPMPFVDRFGQYKHGEWPGKITDEADLTAHAEAEAKGIAANPGVPGQDGIGGWADGPALEATGWFRLEEVEGKWWLVTPKGNLFWSSGVTCIHTGDHTFVEGRADWFDGLPEAEGPFGNAYGRVENAHSMAEPIGGAGRTINFYRLNIERKDGGEWFRQWRGRAYDRLRHWGHTTIGNWSQWGLLEHSPLPFTVSGAIDGVRLIEGGGGYWQKMTDVYDEAFKPAAERAVAGPATRFGENPLCIGYFIDNELSWANIAEGVLASPPDQPARVAFAEDLEGRHGSLEALNAAWETDAPSWEALRLPARRNPAAEADRIAFERAFAERYFETLQDAINRLAPNQLYLGCRFAGAAEPHIMEAAAKHSDVISINAYFQAIGDDHCAQWADWGRPVIIGEFHFGALDRGSFHGGLVPVTSQQARAEAYRRYLESALDCPAVIGAHWFQYIDQPITGRWFDGENYNIGFVTIADTPYPELVEAARAVHTQMYPRRAR